MCRASSYNLYMNQQDAQNSVIKLYFPLDALHVSDYISPKHVENLMENKVQSQEFCASCWSVSYRLTCQLQQTPQDVVIVGCSCYIFELNRSISSKWAIFGLCH